ncbi:MAG: hypothetical protein ACR2P2_03440 [Nakamurella sp.]
MTAAPAIAEDVVGVVVVADVAAADVAADTADEVGDDVLDRGEGSCTAEDGGRALVVVETGTMVVGETGAAADEPETTGGGLTAGEVPSDDAVPTGPGDVPAPGTGPACATDDMTSTMHSAGERTIAARRMNLRLTSSPLMLAAPSVHTAGLSTPPGQMDSSAHTQRDGQISQATRQ